MKVECLAWRQEIPQIYSETMRMDRVGGILSFDVKGDAYSYGKYVCFSELNEREKSYRMNITYEMSAQRGKLVAYLTFYQRDGVTMTRREYFLRICPDTLSIHFQCLPEECFVKAEICFSSFGPGSCRVQIPCFIAEEPAPRRTVKVATTFFAYRDPTIEGNFKRVLQILDNAGTSEDKPDIICFTETVYDRGVPINIAEKFVPEAQIPFDRLEEKAKQYGMYIIFSAHAIEDGLRYNTAYLISPEGRIAGKYRKAHLTLSEYEDGMAPGEEIPVFETPYGKIGILICWDQWFPEAARILQLKGAEIIFWQTAGYHETKMRARAIDSAVYMVTACAQNPAFCSVTDPAGDILARLHDVKKGYLTVEIDLDKKFYETWLSVGDGYGCGKDLYPNERRSDLYRPLLSDCVGPAAETVKRAEPVLHTTYHAEENLLKLGERLKSGT